jgi:hypothetical protein
MIPARNIVWALGLSLALVAANIPARMTRAALRSVEASADNTFVRLVRQDPLSILGATRAVYLDGYGTVLSTEVELAASAAENPFRPAFTKEDIQRVKEKKKLRIAYLKENMRGMLIDFASALSEQPLNENVALAVTIPYFRWEDAAGMPKQILIVAPRKALLDAKAGDPKALSASLKLQEFY